MVAFAYNVAKRGVAGDLRYVLVNYTNGVADTGGVISYKGIGIRYIYFAGPTTEVSEAATTVKVEKNTGSGGVENGSVKLTTVANEDGTVFILGI